MTLLIDIGNTRIKWNLRDALNSSEQSAALYSQWSEQDVEQYLLRPIARPNQVFIANVGGEKIGRLLSLCMKNIWGLTPVFIHSTASAAGVRNAYPAPEKLGVDRWLAAIAAYHLNKKAACVVSVGTATTVDGVDATGQHLGGVIIPGPELMTASLLRNTSDIAVHSIGGEINAAAFADNTFGAINQGAAHATAALIERLLHDMRARLSVEPQLLLTGGACARIHDALRVPCRVIPDLVLRGLALVSYEPENLAAATHDI